VVHALLTGASMAICAALGVKDGFGFSAGFIDFALNWNKADKPWLILLIGAVYAVVYYVLFRVMIRTFNLMTPGRETDDADLVEAGAAPDEPRGRRRETEAADATTRA
jgi:PTS system N-acetylglucosamine-specific IIC component